MQGRTGQLGKNWKQIRFCCEGGARQIQMVLLLGVIRHPLNACARWQIDGYVMVKKELGIFVIYTPGNNNNNKSILVTILR